MLILSTKTVLAYGKVTAEGFVVLKGAKVNEHVSEKSVTPGAIKLRKKLCDDGKVKDLMTTEDLLFSSSSAAAVFVLGNSASGPMTWKNKNGTSLKELESKDTE